MKRSSVSMVVMKGILLMLILSFSITTTVNADINKGKIPKGFQQLGDVALFNETDNIIPGNIIEHAIIPNGFFVPLEKKKSVSKILELNKQYNKQANKQHNDQINKLNSIENSRLKKLNTHVAKISTSISTGPGGISSNSCTDISSQNITFDNTTFIWNSTEDGYVDSSQVAKDLNGDNINDILITVYKYDSCTGLYYYTVEAKNGKDGSNLWNKSVSGNSVWSYGNIIDDINGDHLSDVTIYTDEYDAISGRYSDTIEVVKGKDGTVLWKVNAIDGYINVYPAGDLNGDKLNDLLVNIQYGNSNVGILYAKKGMDGTNLWTDRISNGSIYITSIDDLTGDGLNDVLESVYDYNLGINTIKAKKGNDGTALWKESASYANGYIYAEPTDDLNGDKLRDILFYNYSSNTQTLEAKKGIDGTDIWIEKVPNGYISGVSVGDLNGDGFNDTLVNVYDLDAGTNTLKAKKGTDGTNLWSETVTNGYINGVSAGDLTGDGLNDILENIYYISTGVSTLEAKKGKDGSILWKDSISNGYIDGESVGDLNGDKLNDVLENINYNSNIGMLYAKKGIDGTNLWLESVPNGYIDGESVGDLNGDKLNDILLNIYDSSANIYTLKAKKGIDGTNLWTDSISNGNGELEVESIGDINGDKLNDILVNIYDSNTSIITTKTKKGIDGTDLWKVMSDSYIGFAGAGDVNGDTVNETELYIGNQVYVVAPAVSVNVTSPNGGENWPRSTTHTINWKYTGSPGQYVKIELLKGDKLDSTITSSTLNNGSYSWTIKPLQTLGADYKVRVTSTSNSAYSDASNNNFSISTISDRLFSGNSLGPGQYIVSQNGKIKLTLQGDGNLVLTSDTQVIWASGTNGRSALIATMQSDGNFVMYGTSGAIWSSNTQGYPGAWLGVQNDGNVVIYDQKNKPLWATNTALSITVTSPNGGEKWKHGSNHTITWSKTGNPGTNVKIELLKGTVVNRVISTGKSGTFYSWTIPAVQTPGANYKIRVTSTTNKVYTDTSNNNFAIVT